MIIINQLHLDIDEPIASLRQKIAERLRLPEDGFSYTILKESLDARRRETPRFSYQVSVDAPLSEKIREEIPLKKGEERLLFGNNKWLIAHPECDDAKNSFAYPGVQGENRTAVWDGIG